jgi:hypothetical protein
VLKFGAEQIQKHARDRAKLKELVSVIKKDDWEYFVSKQGIWGSAYLMGPRLLGECVFLESEGKINLSLQQARDFQAAIYVRYRFKTWHDWMKKHLESQPYPAKLTAPNGFTRKFYGRKTEVLGQALAHMPQVVTTYATLKAGHRLWTDLENRTFDASQSPVSARGDFTNTRKRIFLRIEPLHQVHDELVVQWRIEYTSWAVGKIRAWFNNQIVVAGIPLVIPYDGAYGTAWSMDETHKVGDL